MAKIRAFLAFAVCLFAGEAVSQTVAAGAIDGSFSVDGNGAANYTIEIAVPPAPNESDPSLKLVYDNQQTDGVVGVGWQIDGLTQIQRCGRTVPIEGVRGGVNWDANDRYCLGGIRLIAVQGRDGGDG